MFPFPPIVGPLNFRICYFSERLAPSNAPCLSLKSQDDVINNSNNEFATYRRFGSEAATANLPQLFLIREIERTKSARRVSFGIITKRAIYNSINKSAYSILHPYRGICLDCQR